MSDIIKDGGPAFPFPSGPEPRVDSFHERCEGMSLRDWFAGMALPACISMSGQDGSFEGDAANAYHAADAMLAERNK